MSHAIAPPCRKGFTLIEVLVVVAIIALLVAILLPSLARARDQAKTLTCLSRVKQLGTTVSFYFNENRLRYLPPFRFPLEYASYKNSSGNFVHPYWFQYLPFKYLANQIEIVTCPSDSYAAKSGRIGWPDLRGGRKLVWSFAMNDRLPRPKLPSDVPPGNPPYTQMWNLGLLQDPQERYLPHYVDKIKNPSSTIYLLETVQHNLMSGDSKMDQFRLDHGGRKDRMTLLFGDSHGEVRDFDSIWYGDKTTGVSRLSQPGIPGRYKQLWYGHPKGDPVTSGQIIY